MEARRHDAQTDMPAYLAMALVMLLVAVSIVTYLLLTAR